MKRQAWMGLGALALTGLRLATRSTFQLAGATALVTGGSRGLGLAIARELVRRKARVIICARDEAELEAARIDLEARGGSVATYVCDVSDEWEVKRMVADAAQVVGPVDVVVNNAGIIRVGPLESMTTADFEEVMAVNFWGAVHVTRALLPSMQARRRGRIVTIGSIGGRVAVPHLLAYDCAKFAVTGFSEGLRAEVAKDGIKVTTVSPGLMRTGSALHAEMKGDADKELQWFALGDATPVTAMSATRAARRIVSALVAGEADVTLSWQAKLLRAAHDWVPGTVMDVLGIVNRFLPRSDGSTATTLGRDVPSGRGYVKTILSSDLAKYNQT